MKLRKTAIAAAVSVVVGVGAAGQAQAGSFASSLLDVSNFTLGTYSSGTVTPFDFSQFNSLSINDNGTNTAVIVGQPGVNLNASSTTLVAAMDNSLALVGTYAGGQNNFTPSGVPPTTLFSRSDSLLLGTPISAIALGITPAMVGVRAITISETSLTSTAIGNAGSSLNLTSTLDFVLNTSITNAAISFDATRIVRAWTSADARPGSSASANTAWSISLSHADPLTGEAVVDFQWNPNGGALNTGTHDGLTEINDSCNLAANVSASFNQQFAPLSCSGAFLAVANGVTLLSGLNYSLNINHQSQDNAVFVPEPGSLALLGLGLLGLGAFGLRKKSAS